MLVNVYENGVLVGTEELPGDVNPTLSAGERVAAIVDAAPDWRSAMKQLGAEGLLA